eukprot:CAMPEP_0175894314 /NCGR_PEP_ID=MMETSP0107_2-20121207/49925_1 /TAXON_ID=195067 ORGANISM="Goniomonas pacifica, Strain CCMP1869" /NCGR_SAMPLE_ID=MMETSP0107_2 /ASSEMBLY_ACC=CAM_ASM_000203 /LENGTH=101 /DNA_ID=CAMNT_0017215397 /DNA_START=418 /DNA_END=723 /DNA_ORIENTATION=-
MASTSVAISSGDFMAAGRTSVLRASRKKRELTLLQISISPISRSSAVANGIGSNSFSAAIFSGYHNALPSGTKGSTTTGMMYLENSTVALRNSFWQFPESM